MPPRDQHQPSKSTHAAKHSRVYHFVEHCKTHLEYRDHKDEGAVKIELLARREGVVEIQQRVLFERGVVRAERRGSPGDDDVDHWHVEGDGEE